MNGLKVKDSFGKYRVCEDGCLELDWYAKNRQAWVQQLAKIKAIPRRIFDSESKKWVIPNTEYNLQLLKASGFTCSNKVEVKSADKGKKIIVPAKYAEYVKAPEQVPAFDPVEIQRDKINVHTLRADGELIPGLRPYQVDFIKFAEMNNGRVMLGDDMGTGKTLQSLAWLCFNRSFPALIVVNAPTKLQWCQEFKRWLSKVPGCPTRCKPLFGKTPKKLEKYCSYIINWDILDAWAPTLAQHGFQCIVGDEAQAIGNPESKRALAFRQLSSVIPECIVMSGTPARSKPKQFWTCMSCVNPNLFPSYEAYCYRYCQPKMGLYGITFDGATHVKELHAKLVSVMIRRTKDEVMAFLPPKTIQVVPLESDETAMKQYMAAEDQCEESKSMREALAKIMSTAFLVKEKALVEWVEDFLETSNEKLLLFAYHRSAVDLLHEHFKKYNAAKIYGGMNPQEREENKQRFISDPTCKIIVGNVQSLGTGVDGLQTVCCNVAFAEFSTTSTDMGQAMDRLHRGGQERPVNVFYLIAPNTIDEEIAETLNEKAEKLSQVLDGKCEQLIADDLLEIVASKRGLNL